MEEMIDPRARDTHPLTCTDCGGYLARKSNARYRGERKCDRCGNEVRMD